MTTSTRSVSRHRPAGPGFEHRGRTSLPALDGALACYVHRPTGARHLHLDLPAEDRAFLMAFLTPAPDSSGLTHVLEHLVMCGSERYPCRRAFFSMLGRTLSTTMNALTTEDCTGYHFSTRSLADYENLLSVYLDAAFFPRLDRLDFDQEGCRVEIEAAGEAGRTAGRRGPRRSPCRVETEAAGEEGGTPVRRGVVLSEMRGLMHDPEQQLRQALNRCLFPSTPYRFNAGGDPWRIPSLDYETLRAYHRRHYHPGNAVFLSAGTLRPEWLHVRLEELALARFPHRGRSSAPPPLPSLEAPPLEAPSRSVVRYPTVSVTGMADRKSPVEADAPDQGPDDATDVAEQGPADTTDRGSADAKDAASREPAGAADTGDRGSVVTSDAPDRRSADMADAADRRSAGTADAPVREPADTADQERTDASVALAWRLGDTADPVAVVRARFLACCLLEQGDAPLRRALEAPGSPAAALASNGVQETRRRIVFQCGVHGCDPDLAGEIETRVLSAIDAAARDGLDEVRVQDALARIERDLRELHDPRHPFPLELLTRILPAALYGGEPAAALDAPRALAALRAEVRSRKDTAELVRRSLRDNPERVTVTAIPDPAAARRLDAEDRALLEREYGGPAGRQARDRTIERTRALRRRQRSRAGESSLPKIGLDAIGPPRESLELFVLPAGNSPAGAARETAAEMEAAPPTGSAGGPSIWISRGPTGGLVYARLAIDVPDSRPEQLDDVGLFCEVLPESGLGGLAPAETRARLARVCDRLAVTPWLLARAAPGPGAAGSGSSGSNTSGSGATGYVASGPGVPGSGASGTIPPRMMVVLSARALAGDENALLDILAGAHLEARFDESAREVAARARVRRSRELARNGHLHAERVAAARLDPSAAIAERWQGPSALAILARAATGNDEGPSGGESGPGVTARSLEERLHHLHRTLAAAPHQLQIVRDHGDHAEGCPDLPWAGRRIPESPAPSSTRAMMLHVPATGAWIVGGPVNYCARVYPAVTADHPDAGPLAVLAAFLGGDLLQRAVRERGGAYGAGARYCARTCTVRLFSYRDPRLAETLRDFDRAIETLHRRPPDGRRLEEAILRTVREIDKPKAFQVAAFERYLDELQGRGAEGSRALRAAVLGAGPGQLRQAAERYLRPEQGCAGVLAGAGREGELDRLGMHWRRL